MYCAIARLICSSRPHVGWEESSVNNIKQATANCLQKSRVCNVPSLYLSSSVDFVPLFGQNDDTRDQQEEGSEPEHAVETEHKWALRAKTLREVCMGLIAEELLTVHTYSVWGKLKDSEKRDVIGQFSKVNDQFSRNGVTPGEGYQSSAEKTTTCTLNYCTHRVNDGLGYAVKPVTIHIDKFREKTHSWDIFCQITKI